MKPYDVPQEDVALFIQERAKYNLKYRCLDCVHFVEATGECSLGYPNETLMESERYLDERGQFVFCRYFEVW